MIREIETRTEVSMDEVVEMFANVSKKYGFEVQDGALKGQHAVAKYADVMLDAEVANIDLAKGGVAYKLTARCSIRFMGSLDVEEMQNAADIIKAAAVIAQYVNDKLDGKVAFVKYI